MRKNTNSFCIFQPEPNSSPSESKSSTENSESKITEENGILVFFPDSLKRVIAEHRTKR